MALLGGNWNNESNAGVRALNLNNSPGNSNTNISARLCKRAIARRHALTGARPALHAHHAQILAPGAEHQNGRRRLVAMVNAEADRKKRKGRHEDP